MFQENESVRTPVSSPPGWKALLPGVLPVVLVVGAMMLSAEDMGRPAMILASCVGVSGLIAYVAVVEAPSKEGEPRQSILERFCFGPPSSKDPSVSFANDSVKELVDKFRVEIIEYRESLQLLTHIYKRVRGTSAAAKDAAKTVFDMGLLESSLLFLQQLSTEDKRIPIAVDIINELLSKDAIKSNICSSDDHLKNIIDGLVVAAQDQATPPDTTTSPPVDNEGTDSNISLKSQIQENGDTEAFFVPEPKKIPNTSFPEYGYKLIMSIGLLCADNRDAQTMSGDRGAIKVVTDIFQVYGPVSAEVVKWCCWCLIHLTFNHPPNKREFYQRGGLTCIVDSLKRHFNSAAVYEQALGLLINILVYDNQTKMNQSQARQAALACNIFEVLQSAQKQFKGNDSIQAMINQVLQILITDWS